MNALYKAIYNKFNASTGHGAYTSVSGRFYLNVAPQATTFPYVVYFEVTDVDDLYFTEELQEYLIQFNIFSQNKTKKISQQKSAGWGSSSGNGSRGHI